MHLWRAVLTPIRYARSEWEGGNVALAQIGQGDAGWYVRNVGPGQGRQLWRFVDATAMRAGVTNPEGGAGTYYAADPGETIWACLRHSTPWLDGLDGSGPFQRMVRGPAEFHPRVARPIALREKETLWFPDTAKEQRYITSAQNQLGSLIDDLRVICRVVQPAASTLSVYGHEIRNLLILAATEVEMHWRGILAANGSTAKFNTNEFVKLAAPLGLRNYAVHFHPCPDIAPIRPFDGWDVLDPTNSLPWFAAYHGVKHNREHEFDQANLANGFMAVAACAVMMVAQFGQDALTRELKGFLSVQPPAWPIEDMYLMPEAEGGWAPVPLQLSVKL